ncbi:hypothetical protein EON65_31785 [archaeon]|nr:MAG: hypothetical protein EON65_31785 [archaeon]
MNRIDTLQKLIADLQNPSSTVSSLHSTLLSLIALFNSSQHIPADADIAEEGTSIRPLSDLVVLAGLLYTLLQHKKQKIRHAGGTLVSLLAAGTSEDLQILIDAHIFPVLLPYLLEGDMVMQATTLHALHAAVTHSSFEQMRHFVQRIKVLPPLVPLLSHTNSTILLIALDSVLKILQCFESIGPDELLAICAEFAELSGVQKLESLQLHHAMEVYQTSLDLHTRYFLT